MTVETAARPRYEDIEPGFRLPGRTFRVERRDLVRYGGAACDYNVIHWDDRTAVAMGLPSPIAHGMFTMGLALGVLTDWAGDAGAVVDFGGRFPRLVPVPNDGVGVELTVEATVMEKLEPPRLRLSVAVRLGGGDGGKVLTMPKTIVALR
ncbi:MaoC/PaaZ C-terminal domain-containing protein [Streptosporangium saharense]|uniref:MaoC/PaaZ C-terminal domain-containing protein n=1 Tax=Streptosporangium saharense TaxID=1706840 RepID=UPI0033327EAF